MEYTITLNDKRVYNAVLRFLASIGIEAAAPKSKPIEKHGNAQFRAMKLRTKEVHEAKSPPRPKAMDFVREWAGFLSDEDTDAAKLAYLREKYH